MFWKWLWTALEVISLQNTASEGQSRGIFLIVHFGLQINARRHSPSGYAIDHKFGFDFDFWAKLI